VTGWLALFGDPMLDKLVAEAIAYNPTCAWPPRASKRPKRARAQLALRSTRS
jgi:hypothetical protein